MQSRSLIVLVHVCVWIVVPVAVRAQYRIWDFDPDQVHGFKEGPQRDDVVAGELVVDPPTLENLGFRWFIEGDRNGNATVKMAYRRVGDADWREALPMLRINHEIAARYQTRHFRTANLFAGSVLFLEPSTAYEVRFTMHDPDGGAPGEPRTVTVRTRGEPQAPDDGRTLDVYPPGAAKPADAEDAFNDFLSAYQHAKPGDVIFLHAGIHPVKGAPYVLTRGGSEARPIVFRGAGVARTIIEGLDHSTDLFQIPGADHLMFEDLTLRRAHTAIRSSTNTGIGIDRGTRGASSLTVRRCRVEDVINGIWTTSENSRNWYIADNVITGTDEAWYPRPRGRYMDGSHTGVNVYGQGHVVCYNRISRFSDSVAIANYYPPLTDIHKQAINIDFYNNDLSLATDDTIEADYGCHNIRVYRNRCYSAHHALSIQPAYGGPIYLIRNVAFGVRGSFKWSMIPSGPVAYHNTLICSGRAFKSLVWSNGHLRNNLLLGGGAIMKTGTVTPDMTTMDYNGWYVDPYTGETPDFGELSRAVPHRDEELPIRWSQGQDEREYATLSEFAAETGYERHGILVDYGIFQKADLVEPGRTYEPDDYDLRLRPGSKAVDAGVQLPGVNDGFSGRAPDLGACELGRPLPRYGPRTNTLAPVLSP